MKKFLVIVGLILICYLVKATYSPGAFNDVNARLTNSWTTTATTASNVTGMNFQVNPNEVWTYDFVLRAGSDGTAGLKFALNFPSGAAIMATINGSSNSAAATTSSIITAAATLTSELYVTFITQAGIVYIDGTITNGANAGQLQLQGAKVTSGTMTVNSNSFFSARKIL